MDGVVITDNSLELFELEFMDTSRTDMREVEWLEQLPTELWLLIAKHLNATIDILRFRSTCRTCRSFAPLPPPSSSPSFFSPQILIPQYNQTLVQTKLYRLQPIPHHHHHRRYHPSLTTTITPDSCNKGWIIMVGESRSNPVRLLDPFTNNTITTKSFCKVLNLLNFKFIELTQAYSLNYESLLLKKSRKRRRRKFSCVPEVRSFTRVPLVQKAVLFPSSAYPRMVFALYKDGKLCVSKIGDVVMEALMMDSADDEKNTFFDDIIIHMGQVYVVDKWGTILWVDSSSLKLVQFSPKLCAFGTRKQLVVCGGSFYVVDMYIEGEPDNPVGLYEVVGVKVYRLDNDWGSWVDVKELGDSAFVLGKDTNFAVSAKEYYGCEGNCVYFFSAGKACAFSLESAKFKDPNIFWPCPSLFHPKFNL